MLSEEDVLITHWKALTLKCRENPQLKQRLFSLALEKSSGLVLQNIVIAGSAGKTTTKELLLLVLRAWTKKIIISNPENENTRIAIATQILRTTEVPELGVFEIGARQTGDFKFVLKLLRPKIALLLNAGLAHIGEFGSMENLLREKLSVLKSNSLEIIVINGDDERILNSALAGKTKFISFGIKKHNHIRLVGETGNAYHYLFRGLEVSIPMRNRLPNLGLNVAAVLAISRYFEIPMPIVQSALGQFMGSKRRFERRMLGAAEIIDDAFNASPESMSSGLEMAAEITKNKKVLLVLGTMKELGAESSKEHTRIAELILNHFKSHIELSNLALLLIGVETYEMFTLLQASFRCWHFSETSEAQPHFEAIVKDFDTVYLKGSKSMQLEELYAVLVATAALK